MNRLTSSGRHGFCALQAPGSVTSYRGKIAHEAGQNYIDLAYGQDCPEWTPEFGRRVAGRAWSQFELEGSQLVHTKD